MDLMGWRADMRIFFQYFLVIGIIYYCYIKPLKLIKIYIIINIMNNFIIFEFD